MLTNVSTADDDTNSFFSCESIDTHDRSTGASASAIYPFQQRQFQESLRKLNTSMKKSQATRKSLYVKTPKLKDYQRSSTVRNVLHRIEYSSRQIDSYYHHSAAPSTSSSSTRMMTDTISWFVRGNRTTAFHQSRYQAVSSIIIFPLLSDSPLSSHTCLLLLPVQI